MRYLQQVLIAAVLCIPLCAGQTMIDVGSRRLAVYCDGDRTHLPTVVLIPAGGRTATDWASIQPAVSGFARVCSYDHANFGASDPAPVKLQSVDEAVDDLQAWLNASGEQGPYILVGHSGSGFHVRRFEARSPHDVSGMVLVDSAHEEQALRLHELDPGGPAPDEMTRRIGFFVNTEQRLQWKTSAPLIVLGRGKPFEPRARDGSDSKTNRMSDEQFAAWDRTWRSFQQDLAKRSPRGEFRVAEKSGHWIQRDEPELVIEAIRKLHRRD
jgi:pimeloyl-ACP methyl ester carboxylesterase